MTTPSLPERDTTRPAERQGLFRKFDVRRTDGSDTPGGKHDGCEYFVLDVTHDAHAKAALAAYASAVEATHPALASDMRDRYALSALAADRAATAPALREAAEAVARGASALPGRVIAVDRHTAGVDWTLIRNLRSALTAPDRAASPIAAPPAAAAPTDDQIIEWADGFIRVQAFNRPVAIQIAIEAAKFVRTFSAATPIAPEAEHGSVDPVEQISPPATALGWIAVSERLPSNEPGYVHNLLVVNKFGARDVAIWDGYAKYFENDGHVLGGHEVTHWMPLPEAPKVQQP